MLQIWTIDKQSDGSNLTNCRATSTPKMTGFDLYIYIYILYPHVVPPITVPSLFYSLIMMNMILTLQNATSPQTKTSDKRIFFLIIIKIIFNSISSVMIQLAFVGLLYPTHSYHLFLFSFFPPFFPFNF